MGSLFTPKSVRDGATARPSDDDMMSARDEALRQLAAVEQRADAIGPARAGEARAIEWLRDSGRYLAPNGGGDYFFMLVLWLRNVIAVHYVIAISLVLPLALLAVLNLALTPALAGGLPALPGAWGAGALYFWLALAVALVAVLPLGVGYWCTELPTRAGASCSTTRSSTTPSAVAGSARPSSRARWPKAASSATCRASAAPTYSAVVSRYGPSQSK